MTDQPLEIWIAMDETGSWEIAKDEHDVFEALDQNSGGLARRLVRLRVTMRAPVVTDVDVAAPDEVGRTGSVETDCAYRENSRRHFSRVFGHRHPLRLVWRSGERC